MLLSASLLCASAALVACSSANGGDAAPEPSPDGGASVCDEPTILSAVQSDFEANYPGSTFVAMDSFTCEDGWAMADVEFEASGETFPTIVFLRAEGQFWIPTTIEDICATSRAESDVPEQMYVAACGLD